MSQNKNYDDFLKCVAKLEPVEFLGVLKVLCVKLQDENGADRTFEDVFVEMMEKFYNLGRKQKRELLKVVRIAAKSKTKMESETNGS